MPFLREIACVSMCVLPLCTSPGAWMTPERWRMRSVSVVLPASTWATMPMLRMRDRGMRRVVMVDSCEHASQLAAHANAMARSVGDGDGANAADAELRAR